MVARQGVEQQRVRNAARYSIRAINYNHKLQSRIVSAFVPPRNVAISGVEWGGRDFFQRRGGGVGRETNSSRNELTIIASPRFDLSIRVLPFSSKLTTTHFHLHPFSNMIGIWTSNFQNWPPPPPPLEERKEEGRDGSLSLFRPVELNS